MRALALVVVVVLLAAGSGRSSAWAEDRPPTAEERAALAGPWTGDWSGGGYLYDGTMRLNVAPDGALDGVIAWTLRETPYADEADKIGRSGIELVRGSYDAASGSLAFSGYELNDPAQILGLDDYRAVVGGRFETLVGLTAHGGAWDGELRMAR